jgi:flagellar basal-body rod protein FlgF
MVGSAQDSAFLWLTLLLLNSFLLDLPEMPNLSILSKSEATFNNSIENLGIVLAHKIVFTSIYVKKESNTMDKMLYIAASGAKQDLLATAVRANNLANAQTNGFKAQLEQARAMPAYGAGLPSRVFSMTESPTNNYESGPLITTGRSLDAAVQGDGWFSVQTPQGEEAYTRNGSLSMTVDGALQDSKGNLLMGENGPLFLPTPVSNITIGNDGRITARLQGAPANQIDEVGRLKLVNPPIDNMKRRQDGLFDLKAGGVAPQDIRVSVASGMLEGSNVNAVEEMVSMISLQRHYEMQVKLMKKADQMVTSSNTLLRIL